MKKFIYIIIALLSTVTDAFGQSPTWTVNENNFQYTMTFVAFVNIEGSTLASVDDKVAAFVGDECRGVTNLTYVENEEKFFAYLTVFSNENNEVIRFKVYNSVTGVVTDVEKTLEFRSNEHKGDLFQAFSIAQPALNDQAEILSVGLKDVIVNDTVYNGNTIVLYLNKEQQLTDLTPVFMLSEGAQLLSSALPKGVEEAPMDFTEDIEFKVRSEDQSIVKVWMLSAKRTEGLISYYKKDVVCYSNGAIKVVYEAEGTEVVLLKNNETIISQTIADGETIFEDLEEGVYVVAVSGDAKEITINFKE